MGRGTAPESIERWTHTSQWLPLGRGLPKQLVSLRGMPDRPPQERS